MAIRDCSTRMTEYRRMASGVLRSPAKPYAASAPHKVLTMMNGKPALKSTQCQSRSCSFEMTWNPQGEQGAWDTS